MPQGDKRRLKPLQYVVEGIWPHAVLGDHHGAWVAQEVAARLRRVIDANGWSVAEVSRRAGVSRMTIVQVLDGLVWCDLLTIANLEKALEVDLWPGREPGNPPR